MLVVVVEAAQLCPSATARGPDMPAASPRGLGASPARRPPARRSWAASGRRWQTGSPWGKALLSRDWAMGRQGGLSRGVSDGVRSPTEAEAWRLGRDVCWGPSQGGGLGKAEGAAGRAKAPLLFTLSLSPRPSRWVRGVGVGCRRDAGGEGPRGTLPGETEDPKREGSVAGRGAPSAAGRRRCPASQQAPPPPPRPRPPLVSGGTQDALPWGPHPVCAPPSHSAVLRAAQMQLSRYPVSPPEQSQGLGGVCRLNLVRCCGQGVTRGGQA